jgi:hypothetical protein
MNPSQIPSAIEAATSIVRELGLEVDDAEVIHNSDRIAVRLAPCDALARVGPQEHEDGFQFEAEVARRLAGTGSPVGELEPRSGSGVYLRDGFALTFWTYYEQVGEIAPADYADALIHVHAGLRQIDLPAPHITERVAGWAEELRDREQTPELPDSERELLSTTLRGVQEVIQRLDTGDQLLHGEPHPGNVLSTSSGPRFIDLHTCQRGPIEYDIAFLPEDAAALYPGVDQQLVHRFRILNWLGFTTMRWRQWDQFPDRDHWRVEGFRLFREALERR